MSALTGKSNGPRPRRCEDLVSVPVTDIPPITLLLAWPAHSTSPDVAALARRERGGVMPQSGLRPAPPHSPMGMSV